MESVIFEFIKANLHNPVLDRVVAVVTHVGGIPIWLVIAFTFLFFKKYRRSSLILFAAVGGSGFMSRIILKPLFARERPFHAFDIELFTRAPTSYSLPSTHAAMAIAGAIVLFTVNKRWGIAAFILAFLVGFSRVYLMVHYVSDVLAGFALGIIVAVSAIFIGRKVFDFAEKRWKWCNNFFADKGWN